MKTAVVLLLALCAAKAQKPSYDVMVEGAVDFELQPLLAALEHKQLEQIGAWSFWTGTIGKDRVVVARTEMGPMNASASTALGIDRFHPRLVINQGTAGAHVPDLKVFDIVLGEDTVDYGAVRSNHRDAAGGIDVHGWIPMGTQMRLDGDHVTRFARFGGDPAMLALAKTVPYDRGRLIPGVIGSAFQYNRELDYIGWVHATFGTSSEDMESAFAAAVAKGMGVPFLAIRIVSDSEFNHPTLEKAAGEYCAEYVVRLVKLLQKEQG